MKKRALSIFLALVILVGSLPTTALAAEHEVVDVPIQEKTPQLLLKEDNVPAELSADGEWLTIPGIEGGQIKFDSSTGKIIDCEYTVTIANIPAQINGVAVTSIGSDAFRGCFLLTSVTIPEGVTSIGSDAFRDCVRLTSVTIPGGVTSIGSDAFRDCVHLTSVTIPGGVTSIGSYAFWCCGLTSVIIPESVNSIGESVFGGCTDLKIAGPIGGNYNIQFGWTNGIPDHAFDDCNSLTNVTIPEGVTSIGSDAFYECTGLTNVTIPEGVTSIGSDAFSGCTGLTSVTIPRSVTSIEWGVFSGCTGLTSVTIPDSVTQIGYGAFYECTGLTSVTIPESVTSIGYFAFLNCANLIDVYYGGDEGKWNKIEIMGKNDELTSATIHYNSTGPALKHTVPKNKYMFHVVDEKGKDLSGAIVTWNGTTQTTTSKGLATFDLLTVDMPTVTVSKDGYITWTNTNSNWAKSPDRYEDVILYPKALGVYKLASCRYSNSSLMTQDTNLLTTTKTVSLGSTFADSDFGIFYVSCGTNNPGNVDHYELWQGSKKIAQEGVGFFRLSTNQFKDGGGCFIRVVSKDGDKVDTRINLQFKTAKINKVSSVSWGGKSFSVNVPDNVPFLGGSTFNAALPIQLPITFLAADDKVQIGLNVNVAGGDTPSEQMKKARDALRYAKRAGSMNLGKLDGQQEKIFQSLVQKTNKLTVFKGGEVNALGYLEADWGSSKATGHIMIQGKISPAKFGYTTWVVVAPVTANVELSLEGGVIGEISYDWENAHMPQLAVINGVPTLAWVDSPVTDDNSVLWPASATIYTSAGDGNTWSAATTVETVEKPVTQLILGEKDGKKAVAYVADEDGDATTQEDWNLYADGVLVAHQVQGTVTLNQAPGMSSANYMWNGDGYLETANGIQIPAVGISNEYAVTDSRVYYSAAGATEQGGAHLTTVLYDNGVWSEAVTLTGGERYLEDLSVVTWKGQDYLLGMDTLAEITEDNVNDAKNLVWAVVMPSSDLQLDGLSYPTEGLVVGEDVTVTITVTNAGDHNIDSIDVTLGNNHWTETCELAPGQSLDITHHDLPRYPDGLRCLGGGDRLGGLHSRGQHRHTLSGPRPVECEAEGTANRYCSGFGSYRDQHGN